jgi:dihydrofolate reductase
MNKNIQTDGSAINLIVAVDRRWGIGRQAHLLFHIREDMKRFKALTTGSIVVLGRKTLQTFPRGEPLAGRTNVVLTCQENFVADPAIIVHSMEELAETLGQRPGETAYILGGTSIYRQLLPYCRLAFVTKVDAVVSADSFFPDLDQLAGWQLVQEEDPTCLPATMIGYQQTFELSCRFCIYRQDKPMMLSDMRREEAGQTESP